MSGKSRVLFCLEVVADCFCDVLYWNWVFLISRCLVPSSWVQLFLDVVHDPDGLFPGCRHLSIFGRLLKEFILFIALVVLAVLLKLLETSRNVRERF